MVRVIGYMDILSKHDWEIFDPFSFLSISSEAQFIEIVKFGLMIGVFTLIISQIVVGLLLSKRINKINGLSLFISPHTPFEALIKAPLLEETVYRLVGMTAVFMITGSLFWALALTALAFGVGHIYQGFGGFVSATITGLVFGVAFLAGGFVSVLVAHSVINLLVFLSY